LAKKPKYRLQVLLILKERAKRACEIELAKALKQLELEKEKLKELEAEKDKIEKRIAKEYLLLNEKVSGGDAKMKDPQLRLNFIRKLKEDLEEIDEQILQQKETIKRAEKHVSRCRSNYMIAAQEMNMMEKHKELWEKQLQKQLSADENKVMNELGNVIHQLNKQR
jgi:flagellar export protein FliJ